MLKSGLNYNCKKCIILKEVSKLKELFFIVNESLDGGYEAQAVGHSIFTQCDDYADLPNVLRDAVKCHFDFAEMPTAIHIQFTKHEVIAV